MTPVMSHDNEILERKVERHFHLILACRRIGERNADGYTQALLGWVATSHELMLTATLKVLGRRGGRAPRYADLMRAAVRLEIAVPALDVSALSGTSRRLEDLVRFCERLLARNDVAVDVIGLVKADLEELREELANLERVRLEATARARAAA